MIALFLLTFMQTVWSMNSDDRDFTKTIFWAVHNGKKATEEFLKKNPTAIHARDGDNWTPLMLAVGCNYPEIVKYLIEKQAAINIQDNSGATPLIKATQAALPEMIHLLLEKGADANIQDCNGKNARDYADNLNYKRETILQLLSSSANN
jgi:ankyrin repeat protein